MSEKDKTQNPEKNSTKNSNSVKSSQETKRHSVVEGTGEREIPAGNEGDFNHRVGNDNAASRVLPEDDAYDNPKRDNNLVDR